MILDSIENAERVTSFSSAMPCLIKDTAPSDTWLGTRLWLNNTMHIKHLIWNQFWRKWVHLRSVAFSLVDCSCFWILNSNLHVNNFLLNIKGSKDGFQTLIILRMQGKEWGVKPHDMTRKAFAHGRIAWRSLDSFEFCTFRRQRH